MKMTLNQISKKLRLQKSFKLNSSTSFDIHWVDCYSPRIGYGLARVSEVTF